MFICQVCNKTFTCKQNLDYHAKNVDCGKKQCSFCKKIFMSKNGLDNHLNNNICQKHKKHQTNYVISCQVQLEQLKLRQQELKLRQEEVKLEQMKIKQQKPVIRLKPIQNNDHCQVDNITNNNNTVINQMVNISHPLPYGEEEIDQILRDPKVINFILSKPNKSIFEMFRKIHCNPDYPQNQTVYISKRNPRIAMVSDGEFYQHRDADDVIQSLFLDNRDRVSDLVDEHLYKLTPYNRQRHETVLVDEDMAKKTTNDIRLGLFDMEHKVKRPKLCLKFSQVHKPQTLLKQL